MNELRKGLSPTGVSGRIEMRTPDEVSAMLALKACGWGSKRIATEPGCSRNTVKRWLAEGGWCAAKVQRRPRALDGLEAWLGERFLRHAGNADVVRQELAAELGIAVSLRTVERAVAHLRREQRAEARATVRFETRPGQQLQIDFGERRVEIGDRMEKVFFFVATRGYSRRLHARASRGERKEHWFDGMESCFRAFGGVPEEVPLDNARALIQHHDPVSREVVVNPKLHAFARHRGFKVKACAPCRARTKGKDARGVGYVKKHAVAGRQFESFAALEAHLEAWTRDVADMRIHGTTGEAPPAALRSGRGAYPAANCRDPALPGEPGTGAEGEPGLLRRGRWQRLFRALDADPRAGDCHRGGRGPARPACRAGCRAPCVAQRSPWARRRSRPFCRDRSPQGHLSDAGGADPVAAAERV